MDKFSIDSLLNCRIAARTPFKLLYWTTRAFSLGVKDRYEPHFFFWPGAVSFTLFTSARVFEEIILDRGPCSQECHQPVDSVA